MSNVVAFRANAHDSGPHASGEAKCADCGFVWVSAAPIPVPDLECPSCGSMGGSFIHPFAAAEGELGYKCNCGGETFFFVMAQHGATVCRCEGCCGDQSISDIYPA